MHKYRIILSALVVAVACGLGAGSRAATTHANGTLANTDAHLATVYQPPYEQTEAFVVGEDGAVRVLWKAAGSPWQGPASLTPPGLAPPGAPIAAVFQPLNNQVEVFVVGNDGTVWDIWKANNAQWAPPLKLTGPNVAPAGAGIAAVSYGDSYQHVLVIGRDGALVEVWKENNGKWSERTVSGPNVAREGAPLAAVYFPRLNEVNAFVAGRGAASVIRKPGGGAWQQPQTLPHPPDIGESWVPNNAPLTAAINPRRDPPVDPIFDRLELFVVGNDGAVWEIGKDGFDRWGPPGRITKADVASTRAPLAAVDDWFNDDLLVFVVDKSGALQGVSKLQSFPWLAGPVTDPRLLREGTPLAAVTVPFQTEVLYIDGAGALGSVLRKGPNTGWDKPRLSTKAELAPFFTSRDCMRWYRRWRTGAVEVGNPSPEEYCLWIMGVEQFCRSNHAFVAVEFDSAGRRSHFKCAPFANPEDFFDELEHLVRGIGQGLITAYTAAAPFLGVAVSAVACYNGAIFACAALAVQLSDLAGVELPGEVGEGVKIAEQALNCYNGNITDCAQLGARGARAAGKAAGVTIPGIDIVTLVVDTDACYDGVFAACMRLGLAAADAAGVTVGLGPADVADIQACINGDPIACLALSESAARTAGYPLGGVAQGAENARKCANGDTTACIDLGKALVGSALPGGVESAARCATGDTAACTALGKALIGSGLPADAQKAVACDGGDTNACIELGKALVGNALPPGAQNARRCAGGDTNACIELGKALVGSGLATNAEQARQCTNGNANACTELGRGLARAAGLAPAATMPLEGRPNQPNQGNAPNQPNVPNQPNQPNQANPPNQANQPATVPAVRLGANGEVVTTIQYLLNQHGASVSVDGDFGPQTEQAVRAFQQARRLTIDGVVGPPTWQALFVTLQQGSQGNAVRAVQSQLASRGMAVTVDGDFGLQTAGAVRTYQQQRGLPADGAVGPQTWAALVAGR